jgi:precorrin-2 dehydrogenase/sirohydrochlorin ferrochelatase
MIPLMLDPAFPVLLVGRGPRILARLDLVEAAGANAVIIYGDAPSEALVARAGARLRIGLPDAAAIAAARLLFVADLPEEESRPLAETARQLRVAVNVEDVPTLCDFHVPATVRRGKLLLTISTGGAAPGAAARIRADLEHRFGADWGDRLDSIAEARAAWRESGLPPGHVACNVSAMIEANGWLARPPPPTQVAEPAGSVINAF